MIGKFLEAPRSAKRTISLLYDSSVVLFAVYLALVLRYGEAQAITPALVYTALTGLVVSLAVFIRLGLYRAILRYMGHHAITSIVFGCALSAFSLTTASFFFSAGLPRSIPVIYFLISLILIGLPRLMVRGLVQTLTSKIGEPVIIYGAGYCGHQLCAELQNSDQYRPVAFIDDNPKLHKNSILGLSVNSPKRIARLINQHKANQVLLAIGILSPTRRQQIINMLEPYQVKIKTVPSKEDIINGRAQISELVDIDIVDLLGRQQVDAREELLDQCIRNKTVMVTGAGGSIGGELCRQILAHQPQTLILFELNEPSLYQIEQELLPKCRKGTRLLPVIGSVQDATIVERVLAKHKVQTIYHAAAYKHVPLMEQNITAAISNNVLGTVTCAQAAIKHNVEAFVLVSTDKAVRPTNIMGATKRVAELTLQALAQTETNTRFTIVRFGNVLGSSGSVVPLFKEQIKAGGPVTVTHPDVVRYFMTIPEAAELVIQAGSLGAGGDVFVLDMGEPIKIVDLAHRMIHLSGLEVKDQEHLEGDIEIIFSGLRPGEKLFEELLVGNDVEGTEHPRIMKATEASLPWADTLRLIEKLRACCQEHNHLAAKQELLKAPIFYIPHEEKFKRQVTNVIPLIANTQQ